MTPSRHHHLSFHIRPFVTGALCVVAMSVTTAAPLHAKPAPKDGKSVPADCKEHRVKGLAITACLKDADLTVSWKHASKDATAPAAVKRTINPEGTFEGRVVVDAETPRLVALSYDDTECTVTLIVDRVTGAVLYDTGCENSVSCMVKELPRGAECTARLACVDSTDVLKEREVGVCAPKAPPAPGTAPPVAPAPAKAP